MNAIGQLHKMRTRLEDQVKYTLDLDGTLVEMNDFLGKPINLKHTGIIKCVSCGKVTKKSFGQGFCYPCFINSPDNAECIVKPELCRGHLGEGRDVEWEKAHHVQPHYVYLALSSDVKVGVTRNIQVPTRWIDQGASQAIILAETPYRQLAGEIEVALKNYLPDKTNWQRMLKNEVAQGVDLAERKRLAAGFLPEHLQQYVATSDAITSIVYPVLRYPQKVKSLSLEKQPEINGVLAGIKGQYLIFEDGSVTNIRNQSGYVIELNA
jgi:hypothetical protein